MPCNENNSSDWRHRDRRPRSREPARILVADDHTDSRDAICALLEAFGFEVLAARDGREAVDVARAEAPDLVLMDVMMPDVDGLQAIRLLRKGPGTEDMPIIACTAMAGAERRVRRAGADDYVGKPFDTQILKRKLNEWLEGRSRVSRARARPRARRRRRTSECTWPERP